MYLRLVRPNRRRRDLGSEVRIRVRGHHRPLPVASVGRICPCRFGRQERDTHTHTHTQPYGLGHTIKTKSAFAVAIVLTHPVCGRVHRRLGWGVSHRSFLVARGSSLFGWVAFDTGFCFGFGPSVLLAIEQRPFALRTPTSHPSCSALSPFFGFALLLLSFFLSFTLHFLRRGRPSRFHMLQYFLITHNTAHPSSGCPAAHPSRDKRDGLARILLFEVDFAVCYYIQSFPAF